MSEIAQGEEGQTAQKDNVCSDDKPVAIDAQPAPGEADAEASSVHDEGGHETNQEEKEERVAQMPLFLDLFGRPVPPRPPSPIRFYTGPPTEPASVAEAEKVEKKQSSEAKPPKQPRQTKEKRPKGLPTNSQPTQSGPIATNELQNVPLDHSKATVVLSNVSGESQQQDGLGLTRVVDSTNDSTLLAVMEGKSDFAIPPPPQKKPRVKKKKETPVSKDVERGAEINGAIPEASKAELPVGASESAVDDDLTVKKMARPKKARRKSEPKAPDPSPNDLSIAVTQEEIVDVELDQAPIIDEELLASIQETEKQILRIERERADVEKLLRSRGIVTTSVSFVRQKESEKEKFLFTLDGAGAHWDYLLKEMTWMSNDFRNERKWKVQSARKLVREAERVIPKRQQDKKREYANRLANLRRQSNKIAREVRKSFWDKIDRIVLFKNNADFVAEQQEIMDRNLDRLLEQTERYTASLVASASNFYKANKTAMTPEEASALERQSIVQLMERYSLMNSTPGASSNPRMGRKSTLRGVTGSTSPSPVPQIQLDASQSGSDTGRKDTNLALALDDGSNTPGDGDDASWMGPDEQDEEGSDMVDDDPEDDGRAENLVHDLELPLEELLAREYGITKAPGTVALPSVEEGKTKQSPVKRKRTSGQAGLEPKAAKVQEETNNDDSDDDSWHTENEENSDDDIDPGEEQNPDDDGDETALQADMDVPLEELLRREYGIGLGEKGKMDDDAARFGTDGGVESDEDDDEDDDASWNGDVDHADDEIDAEDLDNPDDDGGAGGLDEDLNMPIEELLAKRYGITSGPQSSVENGKDKGVSHLHDLVDDGDVVDESDDASFTLSHDDADDDDDRISEDPDAEDITDAMQLAREAEMPLDELLNSQYHGATFEALDTEHGESQPKLSGARDVSNAQDTTKHAASTKGTGEVPSESGAAQLENALKLLNSNMEGSEINVPVPFLLNQDRPLRTYQREGLNWLVSLHDRKLNGILADEMGLGKTAQTIALLAHLAASCNIWGPHLVVVPTSVILNWDMEFKTWCPGLKVLTYFGSTAERAAKRSGWTKPNAFHVCITSYQLAVQDANVFRRKHWYYIICDEAHALKNSKSQRWQTLLSFQAKRRLLITGTPLQNSLMELWSLMHFLMPEVFRSQHEFRHWFSNPLQAIVEEGDKRNASAVKRLHAVMRPFLLRRLKRDVATQLPNKYEHIVRLPLARRQRFLYEDFISLSSTQSQLRTGGYVGMMAVLMKLRMVCNHPDLFEPRLVSAAFCMDEICVGFPREVRNIFQDTVHEFPAHGRWIGDREFETVVDDESTSLSEWTSLRSRHSSLSALELVPSKNAFLSHWREEAEKSSVPPPFPFSQVIPHVPARVSIQLSEAHSSRAETVLQSKLDAASRVFAHNRGRLESQIPIIGRENVVLARRIFGGCRVPASLFIFDDSLEQVVEELSPILERFVFVTPPAQGTIHIPFAQDEAAMRVRSRSLGVSIRSNAETISRHEALLHPVHIRQKLSFPDRYLVQYDCGKLQTLAIMLRRLKQNGHRVLIFTQMSRMLDILERFLNLHSFTYFRLDGSTKVEERQSMMDRFNRDPRIFCFILSTRSGGLGINLTGADTVIFYDSDWNPSMDAQAQDRAHRIGQTRDVHIYRLVSEQTIEENILLKSNQKRHLNRLSVEDGRFSSLLSGLDLTNEDALAAVEDESDRSATLKAKREERELLGEEDEEEDTNAGGKEEDGTRNSGANDAGEGEIDNQDDKMEDLQGNVLMTRAQFQELESKLKPIDSYGIEFRSQYFIVIDRLKESRRQKELQRIQMVEEQTKEWEIEALELAKRKAEEEAESEMVGDVNSVLDETTGKTLFELARRCFKLERKVRRMTGRCWQRRHEKVLGLEKRLYYFNEDTLETSWERPTILDAEEERRIAWTYKWSGLADAVLVRIAHYLPSKEAHLGMALVCRKWFQAIEPEICIYAISASQQHLPSEEVDTEFLRVGSRVEARHLGGDTWFAGVIVDTLGDGSVSVMYADGEIETRVKPGLIRKDQGGRVTLVRSQNENGEKFGPIFETFNPKLASHFGCGTMPPDSVVHNTALSALSTASVGTTVVLRPGVHSLGAGGNLGQPGQRIFGEAAWSVRNDFVNKALHRLFPDESLKKNVPSSSTIPDVSDIFDPQRSSTVGIAPQDTYLEVCGGDFVGLRFGVRVSVRSKAKVLFRHCLFSAGLNLEEATEVVLDSCVFSPRPERPAILFNSERMGKLHCSRCSLKGSQMALYFSKRAPVAPQRARIIACDMRHSVIMPVGGEAGQESLFTIAALSLEGNIFMDAPASQDGVPDFVLPPVVAFPLVASHSSLQSPNLLKKEKKKRPKQEKAIKASKKEGSKKKARKSDGADEGASKPKVKRQKKEGNNQPVMSAEETAPIAISAIPSASESAVAASMAKVESQNT